MNDRLELYSIYPHMCWNRTYPCHFFFLLFLKTNMQCRYLHKIWELTFLSSIYTKKSNFKIIAIFLMSLFLPWMCLPTHFWHTGILHWTQSIGVAGTRCPAVARILHSWHDLCFCPYKFIMVCSPAFLGTFWFGAARLGVKSPVNPSAKSSTKSWRFGHSLLATSRFESFAMIYALCAATTKR